MATDVSAPPGAIWPRLVQLGQELIADEECVTGGEDDVRWPPESERGESDLERGPRTMFETDRATPAQEETSQGEFEPREQGAVAFYVREDGPRLEGPTPAVEDVGRNLSVDARIALPEEQVDCPTDHVRGTVDDPPRCYRDRWPIHVQISFLISRSLNRPRRSRCRAFIAGDDTSGPGA